MTAPIYLMFAIAILQLSLYLWTVLGLKHAVDMSARCAGIGLSDCADVASTQAFAASQAYGLTIEPTRFAVATESCGRSVSIAFDYVVTIPLLAPITFPVDASSCFPTS
jgi:hypothetical protein